MNRAPHTCTHMHTHAYAHSKQRSVSEQEALQLDEELESRLSDARSKLEIEVSTWMEIGDDVMWDK